MSVNDNLFNVDYSAISTTKKEHEEKIVFADVKQYEQDLFGYYNAKYALHVGILFSVLLFGISYIIMWEITHLMDYIVITEGMFGVFVIAFFAIRELYIFFKLSAWASAKTCLVAPIVITLLNLFVVYRLVVLG